MQPLARFAASARAAVRAVLTDIDDTLTDGGRLGAAAYGAMEALTEAGIAVVPVTGRPAGWCDHIARMWPVAGVVGENGAFCFRYDRGNRRMIRHFWRSEAQQADDRRRLDDLRARILAEVPGTRIPSDQPYRLADLAIDFAEDTGPLEAAAIDRILALFEAAGARAKVSSIHVNGWFGDYDKLAMSRRFLAEHLGLDPDRDNDRIVYVGDSPNDAPMFQAFRHSVGVANVREFLDRIETPPAWVTDGRGGAGFVELSQALLAARS
jgi:hypothetical protein